MSQVDDPRNRVDSSVPHSARVWNHWVGGKDNYAVDRELAEQVRESFPEIVDIARADRAFLARAVRYLVTEAGVRQFLDIGTGLPTADNTHEIAQRLDPGARVVYVDNDPLVLTHARALLTGTAGCTDYLDADVTDPDEVLRRAAEKLDFEQPVAVMLLQMLGHIPDKRDAKAIVQRIMAALPSGSHLVVSDTLDTNPAYVAGTARFSAGASAPYVLHSPHEIDAYFEGLDLVAPGPVPTAHWRPDEHTPTTPLDDRAAIGRKP